MQPHGPYFGDFADELPERQAKAGKQTSLTPAARNGDISIEDYREVYRDNLEAVLEYVYKLCGELEGKIAITADHGELLGSRAGLWRYWDPKLLSNDGRPIGHAKYLYVPELWEVPLLFINSGERPDVTDDPPVDHTEIDEGEIEKRLETLGYK